MFIDKGKKFGRYLGKGNYLLVMYCCCVWRFMGLHVEEPGNASVLSVLYDMYAPTGSTAPPPPPAADALWLVSRRA